jgi:hypothetical protein
MIDNGLRFTLTMWHTCCRRGHEAVAAAADEAVQHIASSRAVAEELRAQQAHREAELSQHCSHLQQQAEQMQDALQQQLEAAQQQAAARQQQILVKNRPDCLGMLLWHFVWCAACMLRCCLRMIRHTLRLLQLPYADFRPPFLACCFDWPICLMLLASAGA